MLLSRVNAFACCGMLLLLPFAGCSPVNQKQADSATEDIRLESEGNSLVLNPRDVSLISNWTVEGKQLVAIKGQEPLADAVPSVYELISKTESENGLELEFLERGRSDNVGAGKLKLLINPSLTEITVASEVSSVPLPEGKEREALFKLPLSYEGQQRSRVVSGDGDPWDTRHQYLFHATQAGVFLNVPDRNDWRYLGIDVFETGSYHLWKRESSATSELLIHQGKNTEELTFLSRDFDRGVSLAVKESPSGHPYRLLFQSGDKPSIELITGAPARKSANIAEATASGKWKLTLTALTGDDLHEAFGATASELALPTGETAVQDCPAEGNAHQEASSSSLPTYVTAGYPFERGALKASQKVLVEMGEHIILTQSKALAFWPDGSVKWSLLTFPLTGEMKRKTMSNGGDGPTLLLADNTRLKVDSIRALSAEDVAGGQTKGMSISQTAGGIFVAGRELAVFFSHGEQWLKSLKWNGAEMLEPTHGEALFTASFARPDEAVKGLLFRSTSAASQTVGFDAKELEVEETGIYRTVVRIKGEIVSEGARIGATVRAILYRDDPKIDFRVSCVFGIEDPRETSVESLGVTIPLASTGAVEWMQGEEVVGESAGERPSGLLQLTPFLAYQYEGEEAVISLPTEPRKAPLFGKIGLKEGSAIAMFRKFAEYAPKGLAVDTGRGGITFELWPLHAGTMDMRRYSLRSHRAQGESASSDPEWVNEVYYKKLPVYGIGRTFEFSLAFQGPDNSNAAEIVTNYTYPALLHAGAREYERTGAMLPQANPEGWPRAWENWENFARFWLHHQEKYAWYGFWNYGDVRHRFRSGFGQIVPPAPLRRILQSSSTEERNRIAKEAAQPDYIPSNDWAFDNGRWGWSNTEGLPGLFFQSQYLRSADRALFEAAEAAAFHARDVVTRHAGPLVGYGTRHGVQHWSDGNHEERQTIVLEYKTIYYLTGHPEFLDTLNTVYEQHYSKKDVSVHADHSARLAGLLFHWETTGDTAEAAELKRYIRAFAVPEGISNQPSVKFPGAEVAGPPKRINEGGMFFQTFGGMHSLLEYQLIFNDPQLHASLIASAEACINDKALSRKYLGPRQPSVEQIHWGVLAYAARYAENKAVFSDFIARSLEAKWSELYQTVSRSPQHWSGKTAFLRNNTPGSFFWMNWAPYYLSALPKDTVWNDQVSAEHEAREREGVLLLPQELDWQREYDRDELILKYLSQ